MLKLWPLKASSSGCRNTSNPNCASSACRSLPSPGADTTRTATGYAPSVYGWLAIGKITVGVLSLSLFWGIAVGVLAVGSLAFGWWVLGCAAVGVKRADGFAAVARDYAVGIVASSTEAGTAAAKGWIRTQWLPDFTEVIVHQLHWWILGSVAVVLALRVWRDRQARRDDEQSRKSADARIYSFRKR